MAKQVKVAALNARILKVAENVSKAVELEANEILAHAEAVVKQFVPSRFVKRTLASIEAKMENEGVEILFDKTVSRQDLRKTASEEANQVEIDDLVDKIVDAIVDELEDVLKDADEVSDEEVEKVASEIAEEDDTEIEAKLKGVLERKLHAKGIYAKLARTATKKKSIADKIREAAKRK